MQSPYRRQERECEFIVCEFGGRNQEGCPEEGDSGEVGQKAELHIGEHGARVNIFREFKGFQQLIEWVIVD